MRGVLCITLHGGTKSDTHCAKFEITTSYLILGTVSHYTGDSGEYRRQGAGDNLP